jgi:hypothetical protein
MGGLGGLCEKEAVWGTGDGIDEGSGTITASGESGVVDGGDFGVSSSRGFGVAKREGTILGVGCRVGGSGWGVTHSVLGVSGAIRKYWSPDPSSSEAVTGEISSSRRLDRVDDVVDVLAVRTMGDRGRKDENKLFLKSDGVRGRLDLSDIASTSEAESGKGTEPIVGVVGRESSPLRIDFQPMVCGRESRYWSVWSCNWGDVYP